MSWFPRPLARALIGAVKPFANRCRSYLIAPLEVRLAAVDSSLAAISARDDTPADVSATVAPAAAVAPVDVNHLLHHSRSAFLRTMPPGARVVCSAGCAGNWYFEWVERCYGHVANHIGVEYYTAKPDDLPSNVTWIANTVSDMSGVGNQSCDLVFSGQNLEHLWPEEVIGFLLESSRILRAGGHLVIDSPNRDLTAPLNWSHPEHTVEVTVSEAIKLVSLAGFDVVRTCGIWLCRDPRTGRVLPFDPNVEDEWSVPERLITAAGEPNNSFIWWIESRRTARAPDAEALRAEMLRIFEKAWPERVQRLLVGCGETERRADGEWVTCAPGQSGAMVYGPFFPLRAGKYAVTFDLSVDGAGEVDPNALVARCEVMLGAKSEIVAYRDLRAADINTSSQVSLEFELPQLEFGVQFRCISFGAIKLSCRRGVTLAEERKNSG